METSKAALTYPRFQETEAQRITSMRLPERAGIAPPDVRTADRALLMRAPSGYMDTTHFDTVRFPPPEVCGTLLEGAGVLVSPGYQFGPDCSGHFRICYAREEGAWAAALDRMVAVLDDPWRNLRHKGTAK
jgi:aspartate/methionine/tyrosine aminotransferase